MEKIKKNNKDLEKSGGTISINNKATTGSLLDKDLDPKDKVLESPKNEQPQSFSLTP